MDTFFTLLGNYYGLDWATLICGTTASYLITGGRLKPGFAINLVGCSCGFAVAYLSGQNGFIVYNILLLSLNIRGLLRKEHVKPQTVRDAVMPVAANRDTMPAAASALARAR